MQRPNSTSSFPLLPLTPANSYDSYHTPTSSTGDRHIVIGNGGTTDSLTWVLNFDNFDFDNPDLELDLHRNSFDQEEQSQRNVEVNASYQTESVMPSRLNVGDLLFPSLPSCRTHDSDNGTSSVGPSIILEPPALNRSGR